jgi:hypothetical protein
MKVERHWILVRPEAESSMGKVRNLQLDRAVDLARNMGVTVDRRWTFELDSLERELLAFVMRATDGTSTGCACEVLRAALLVGLVELADVVEKERQERDATQTKTEEKRTDVDTHRTN